MFSLLWLIHWSGQYIEILMLIFGKLPELDYFFNLPFCCRLCSDGEEVSLYHTADNSRVYHKEELKSFEIKPEVSSCVSSVFMSARNGE